MKRETLKRQFIFNNRYLPDPNPSLTPEQVRSVLAAQFPEITSAVIEGPSYQRNREIYTFRRAVGTKG